LSPIIAPETPLIGIEPSAILTFRDEFIRLVNEPQRERAKEMAKSVFTIEEFLAAEIAAGNIQADSFSEESQNILLHGHCHQKALSSVNHSVELLSFPVNYQVKVIPSGCCGMAGSFGYEKKHYDVSMKIGELVLFPAVRNAADSTLIAAAGTSCRHQIQDGTRKTALHPIEILWQALKPQHKTPN
jgi:Fe-S oxidoreductase